MAKVTITLVDTGSDNGVDVKLDFDPPISAETHGTPAQHAAVGYIEWLQAHGVVATPEADGEAG